MVERDSCAELVSGLALITALAFGAAREPQATSSAELPTANAEGAAADADDAAQQVFIIACTRFASIQVGSE